MKENLPITKKELRNAKECLEKLKRSNTLDEFEGIWTDFLDHLEKAWEKSNQEALRSGAGNKFQGWRGHYKNKRRNDQLLQYLEQSRNCDQHTLEQVLKKTPGGFTPKFVNPKGGYIKYMSIENGSLEYEGDPMEFKYSPALVETIPVRNRDRSYPLPIYHQGKALKNRRNPFEIAQLGLHFYERYVRDLEDKFFSKQGSKPE